MINAYRRTARTCAELNVGELVPMVEAIPELAEAVSNGPITASGTKWVASEVAQLPRIISGPSWTRTRSQWITNAATCVEEAAFLSTFRHLDAVQSGHQRAFRSPIRST